MAGFLPPALLALGLSIACAGAAAADGIVLVLSGEATATRTAPDGTPTERRLRANDEISAGDLISTGRNTRLQLRFTDGSIVSLQPSTRFQVDEYRFQGEQQRGFFSLLRGALRTTTGAIGKRHHDDYKMRTPTATIGVRGTAYSAQETVCDPRCSPGNRPGLLVAVNEGRIQVVNAAGSLELSVGQFGAATSSTEAPRRSSTPPVLTPTRRVSSNAQEDEQNGTKSSENESDSSSQQRTETASSSSGRGDGDNARSPSSSLTSSMDSSGSWADSPMATRPGSMGGLFSQGSSGSDPASINAIALNGAAGLARVGGDATMSPNADRDRTGAFEPGGQPLGGGSQSGDQGTGGSTGSGSTGSGSTGSGSTGSGSTGSGSTGSGSTGSGSTGSGSTGSGSTGSGSTGSGSTGSGSTGNETGGETGTTIVQLPVGTFTLPSSRIALNVAGGGTNALPPRTQLSIESDGRLSSFYSAATLSLTDSMSLVSSMLSVNASTKTVDAGADEFVSWGRWTTATRTSWSILDVFHILPVQTQVSDVHYLIGIPTATLPTAGTFDYHLSGATAATISNQPGMTGTLNASATVQFSSGSATRIGLQGNVLFDAAASRYDFNGQMQAPAGSSQFTGTMQATQSGAPLINCNGGCPMNVNGGFYGPQAERMGMGYSIQGRGVSGATIDGVGVFNRGASPTPR